jgi:hypothetical protein
MVNIDTFELAQVDEWTERWYEEEIMRLEQELREAKARYHRFIKRPLEAAR